MKRIFLWLAVSILTASLSSAQEIKPRFNPDLTYNTLRAEYGMLIPISPGNPVKSGELLSLSYTRRFSRHWGWRTGIQYATDYETFADHFGIPVSVVFRSGTYGFKESVQTAVNSTASGIVWDGLTGYDSGDIASRALGNFLFFLFRRGEGFAGVTPGYLFGDEKTGWLSYSSGIDHQAGLLLNSRFTLTADAGFTLSIPIWRFSLDISPAFHYLVTNNFSEYHQAIDPQTGNPVGQPSLKPLRWQFSLGFGLSYLF